MSEGVKLHPVLPVPRAADFMVGGRTEAEAFSLWQEAHRKRHEMMEREKFDPLRYGYEPGVWKLVDAVQEQACYDVGFLDELERRFGLEWDAFCKEVRALLGLEVIKIVLIPGANRSGKTEYCSKRTNQHMMNKEEYQAWCYAETGPNSIRIQQKAIRRNMAPEFREETIKTATAYINYSTANGFTNGHIILPETLSEADFRNYAQDVKTVEGPSLDLVWADELIPPTFMNTLPNRIADRDGIMWVSFTPVQGYTPVVAEFLNSAVAAFKVPAYLLPKDGAEPDLVRALGFETPEEMAAANADGIKCKPWDFLEWFEWARLGREQSCIKLEKRQTADGRWVGPGYPLPEPGRIFEEVPRVMRCHDSERAVVFFHPMDNPYANPASLWAKNRKKPKKERRIRMYGVAERSVKTQFPKFDPDVHVVPDAMIPKEGTNYQILDPTPGGRPYVWGYFRVTRHGAYLYREFPRVDLRPEEVDEDGFPSGEWAIVSEKKGGVNDGEAGPACQPIGWGTRRYKEQFAKEEEWADCESGQPVEDWGEENGSEEQVAARYMDPRAAEMPRQTETETTTLIEMFEDLDLFFEHALAGKNTGDRIRVINDLLDFERNEDGEIVRYPQLRVAESAKNSIYCLGNYLGVDGQKGVMKDFVDVLGYFAMLNLEELGEEAWETEGGGFV